MDEKVVRRIIRQVSDQLTKEILDGSFYEQLLKKYAHPKISVKDSTLFIALFAKDFAEKLVSEVLVKLLCYSPINPEDEQ